MGDAPIFRNRSGAPYSKDTLGDDFRDVRTLVFGPNETRRLADFRRAGIVEALAGGIDAETLSNKMANTLSQSNFLHDTYARRSSLYGRVMQTPPASAGAPN